MELGGYQFIHVESYGREGSKQTKTKKNGDTSTSTKWSAREILAEQWREDGACRHIENPGQPGLLYGVPPLEILPMIDEWAEQTKDAQGRKLRKDGLCILVGVASLPRDMEDSFPEFAEHTLAWLQEKYGDRLKSVVVHNDEAHPHLHFSVLPRVGEKFDDIHEGFRARNEAKRDKKKPVEQNQAFIEAMRNFQDEFSEKVAMSHGLTRLGPGRRRLTRQQWKLEKKQAQYHSKMEFITEAARKQAYEDALKDARSTAAKIIAQAHSKAKEIIEQAQIQSKAVGSRIGDWMAGLVDAWHKPTIKAQAQAAAAKKREEEEKKRAVEYANNAKKWADQRVADTGNKLVLEKSKVRELGKELDKEIERNKNLKEAIAWYEMKYGMTPKKAKKV